MYFPDLRLKSTVIIISSLFIWQLIFDFFHKRFCLLLVFHWQKKCWSRQQLSLDKHDKKGSAVQFLCFKKYFLQFSSHNMMWRVGLTWMIIYVIYKICATKCDSFFFPRGLRVIFSWGFPCTPLGQSFWLNKTISGRL